MRTNVSFTEIPKLLYMDGCKVKLPEWKHYWYVNKWGDLCNDEFGLMVNTELLKWHIDRNDWEVIEHSDSMCSTATLYLINDYAIASTSPEAALELFYSIALSSEKLREMRVQGDVIIDPKLHEADAFTVDDPNDVPNECRREDAGHVPDTLLFNESE